MATQSPSIATNVPEPLRSFPASPSPTTLRDATNCYPESENTMSNVNVRMIVKMGEECEECEECGEVVTDGPTPCWKCWISAIREYDPKRADRLEKELKADGFITS